MKKFEKFLYYRRILAKFEKNKLETSTIIEVSSFRLLTKIPKYQASIDVMVFFFKKNKP